MVIPFTFERGVLHIPVLLSPYVQGRFLLIHPRQMKGKNKVPTYAYSYQSYSKVI